jgi:hypothetical protein
MKKRKWIFIISVTFNIAFIIGYILNYINSPNYKLGVLQKDIKVGVISNNDTTLFLLPKGITVRNVSPQGIGAIGQFENNRFEIIITTDREDVVDYKIPEKDLSPFGNYYTADSDKKYQ